jgi:hypothetical protein
MFPWICFLTRLEQVPVLGVGDGVCDLPRGRGGWGCAYEWRGF